MRHPNKRVWLVHQFRQAYDLDRTDLARVRRERGRPRDCAVRSTSSTGGRSARREKRFAISQNVADRLERLDRPRRGGRAPAAAGARLPLRRVRRLRALGRAGSTARSASTCCSRRPRPTRRSASSSPAQGPDRERLERVGARATGLNGRVEFRGRVDADELADLYARCGAVYYAPVDEDFGMVPYEAFLSEQAGRDHDRRGRAARRRRRPPHGPRDCAARRRARRRAASISATTRPRAQEWGRAGKAVAERVTWDSAIERLLG